MSRLVSLAALLTAVAASPALGADWTEFEEPVEVEYGECGTDDFALRGSLEPKDWAGLNDECDPLDFEFGTRYWYSLGSHRMSINGDQYSEDDSSHIIEGHLRITDHSSDVFVKGIAGYSAVINSSYTTPTVPLTQSQAGRILYLGADIAYAPLGEGDTMFGGFLGYQYWNDSPDMGREPYVGGSEVNDISYHMLKLGLTGRVDFGGVVDLTAEVAAIPYAPVWGNYGALDVPIGWGLGNQTSSGRLGGWLYGASAEVMARFHPTENWTVGLGGRAWYLTGEADMMFNTDAGGGTQWITKVPFTTFRYGLLGEVTYRF